MLVFLYVLTILLANSIAVMEEKRDGDKQIEIQGEKKERMNERKKERRKDK